MMRRMFWFLLGVATGVWATVTVKKRIVDIGQRLTPANVLSVLIDGARKLLDVLIDVWKSQVAGTATQPAPPGDSVGV